MLPLVNRIAVSATQTANRSILPLDSSRCVDLEFEHRAALRLSKADAMLEPCWMDARRNNSDADRAEPDTAGGMRRQMTTWCAWQCPASCLVGEQSGRAE